MESFSLKRNRDQSILSEVRRNNIRQDDFLAMYPVREKSKDAVPAQVTKQHMVDGFPLLFIDKKGAFLNNTFFSQLNAISITQIPYKKVQLIGTCLKPIPFKTLVSFLIDADIICTYIHIESSMTVTLSSQTRAEIKGTHTYFTNEENEEPFSFVIELDHENNIYCLHNP